jgi:type II secretory pathway pseudopilin PulG
MLVRVIVMVSVSALALALAACAAVGESMAASAAEQAALIAATQVSMATTQAIDELETASTQMSTQVQAGQSPALPKLPPVGKGTVVIFTPKFIIIQKDGQRFVIPRDPYQDDDADQ